MTSKATLKLRVSELPLVRPSPRLADPVQTGGGGGGGGGHGHGCCAKAGPAAAKDTSELSIRVVIRNVRSFENGSITIPRSPEQTVSETTKAGPIAAASYYRSCQIHVEEVPCRDGSFVRRSSFSFQQHLARANSAAARYASRWIRPPATRSTKS